jgi:hypothetical protein
MTVGEMRERMSNAEFVRWSIFHARRRQDEELAARKAESGGGKRRR